MLPGLRCLRKDMETVLPEHEVRTWGTQWKTSPSLPLHLAPFPSFRSPTPQSHLILPDTPCSVDSNAWEKTWRQSYQSESPSFSAIWPRPHPPTHSLRSPPPRPLLVSWSNQKCYDFQSLLLEKRHWKCTTRIRGKWGLVGDSLASILNPDPFLHVPPTPIHSSSWGD